MKWIRQLHFYLGVLFAPMIIFLAFSGALQTFRLQDSPKGGGTYTPPAWIVRLAEVHINQRTARDPGARPSVPLKWFMVVMALGLITTSILGLYMAFTYNYDKRLIVGLIILGFVIPVALLYL
ncbi:MAG TPA: hypothetical protein VGX92_13175 [Pyrinomonadaceae bacterium]|jgi:uncharacterized iron-regulated membrane protein|nr:hypothetical protein [Pyrinomonadaceae bacterium]